MGRFARTPLPGPMLLLLGVALVTEGWLWSQARRQSLHWLAALEQKKQERAWIEQQQPAPSEQNERAIGRELASTQESLAALRAVLQGGAEGGLGVPPARAVDLHFAIAAYVEGARAQAARAQVMIRADERFGFASHAHEGPEAGLVPAVFRQRAIAQRLVEALLEAQPRSLAGVRRERPRSAAERALPPQPRALSGSGGQAEDFFDFAPALALRVPGQVDSDAFRLEFTGQTASLRTFLNALAGFGLPFIVRSVEVEPLAVDAGAADASPAPMPLVAQGISRFAVVVECILPGPVTGRTVP